MKKSQSRPPRWSAATIVALFVCWMAGTLFAETEYRIAISDIRYSKVYKNWLLVPTSVDLEVHWAVSAKEIVNGREQEISKDSRGLPFTFQIHLVEEGSKAAPRILEVQGAESVQFSRVPIGGTYAFRVRAYGADAQLVAESEAATIVVGKGAVSENLELAGNDLLYYLHPGRWQLATLGKADIYDRSTALGKVAFIFLSVTAMLSFLILVLYSSRTLYLGNIFPYKRTIKKLGWSMFMSCDMSYENRLTNKFRFVLKAWEMIAKRSKGAAEQAVKNIPAGLSSTEKMASVDVACMEYWTSDGDRAIEAIEDIISFPDYNDANGTVKNPDDLLTELVIKIEDNFHDLLGETSQNGDATNGYREKEDMQELIEEIYEPVVIEQRPMARLRRWVLRKGVMDIQRGLRPFPTSRIIHAGLSIHRMNGYRWLKSNEEVKRAFEDRASNEIELLKRKSKIEWFWNYGALAPLVGLFGTVTGITYAFQQLSQTSATPDFVNTIQLLSNGIFEALWTTIFGLANGIFFVIIYYYFKHKLDWIYAKWEEIYVTITEKL